MSPFWRSVLFTFGIFLPAQAQPAAGGLLRGFDLRLVTEGGGRQPSGAPIATAYQPLEAVRQRVRQEFAANAAKLKPPAREPLLALMAQPDPLQVWARSVVPYGLRSGDMADAFAAYWLLQWRIAHGQTPSLSPEQKAAFRQQAVLAVQSNARYKGLSETQRQAVSEVWMYSYLFLDGFYTAASQSRNAAMRKQLQETALAQFREASVDLMALQWTPTGLRAAAAASTVPAPTQGMASALPIAGIYLHLTYTTGVGGAVYPTYQPHVLFTDGTLTTDLSYLPASAAGIPEWRGRRPNAWGRWTKSGSSLSIQWDSPKRKPETWDKWLVARAGSQATKLSGFYRSISGGGNTALGGDVQAAAWSSYDFAPDGTVTTKSGSAASSGGGGTGVGVSSSSRRPEQTGRYRIDGHAITLEFPGQPPLRQWFYLYADSDRTLGIGNRLLSKKR
ncbi:MAG TPA: hypothetical protein VFQ91_25785 [Bryobacteraceae bacterium]|nr:hypothetical protein [Bryobacteraceae bacterium]